MTVERTIARCDGEPIQRLSANAHAKRQPECISSVSPSIEKLPLAWIDAEVAEVSFAIIQCE